MTTQLNDPKPTTLTRVLDSIDRGHARAADRMHTVRNSVRARLDHGLDVLEGAIGGLRVRLDRADQGAADGIIKAQGVASSALEKLRHARSLPEQVTS